MNNFQHTFPHRVNDIKTVRRYEPVKFSGYDGYRSSVAYDTVFEIEIKFDDTTYNKLSDYVSDKLEIDEFIRSDKYASELYDQLMTYFYLKK